MQLFSLERHNRSCPSGHTMLYSTCNAQRERESRAIPGEGREREKKKAAAELLCPPQVALSASKMRNRRTQLIQMHRVTPLPKLDYYFPLAVGKHAQRPTSKSLAFFHMIFIPTHCCCWGGLLMPLLTCAVLWIQIIIFHQLNRILGIIIIIKKWK